MSRREFDFYPTTHEGATLGLLHEAPLAFSGTCIECCSGQHHMTKVLRASGKFDRVWTNDIVPSLDADFHEDARDPRIWREVFPTVDWVITNPTFAGALPIVRNARQYARVGVAFYLRITFWEPTVKGHDPALRRGGFLRDHPPTGFMPMSRISHTEDGGTDSATCAWFIWINDWKTAGLDEPYAQFHKVLILGDDEVEPDRQLSFFGGSDDVSAASES